jgi:hypothetical protein
LISASISISISGLFIYSPHGEVLLPLSPKLRAPCTLCYVSFSVAFYSVFCLFFFLSGSGISLSRGLCWFIPGVAVGVPHATYLLTCWSVSTKQVRSLLLVAQKPSWFLSTLWHGEVMCRLGVHSFVSSWWFFLPGVSPVSQQDFYFKEHTLSASCF